MKWKHGTTNCKTEQSNSIKDKAGLNNGTECGLHNIVDSS